jgi:hypothetical protein
MTEPVPHRKKRRQGKPRPVPVLPDVPGVQWGPAMAALPSDKYRAFVLHLYDIPPGWGCNAKAARLAGFGTDTSSPASMAQIGHKLAHDDRVLAAIAEEDKKRIRASAPRALSALQRVVENPDHRDHVRAVSAVLDRTYPVQTQHQMHVVHEHVIDHRKTAVEDLRRCKALGIPHEKLLELFGFSGLSIYEKLLEREDAEAAGKPSPKLIEGTAVEVAG